MTTPSLSWRTLRQLAWDGPQANPAADADAHQVLLLAGNLARAHEVAWQPIPGVIILPPVAPVETQPVVDDTGEHLLQRMLAGEYNWLLPNYYAGLAARGYRVLPRVVAAVLTEQAKRPVGPDPHLRQVLGERGRWLAQLNPAWQRLLRLPEGHTWVTDATRQREQFIRDYRAAAPDQAWAFLAARLPDVPVSEQPQVLQALSPYLGPAAEPLLTPCLRAADPAIWRVVQARVVLIPGNWLVERVWEYARAFLTLRTCATGSVELLVTLPQQWQEAWLAVGIERYQYGGEEPEPWWWLQQMLVLIPPQRWTDQWDLTPGHLLQLAASTAEGPALFAAWTAATILHTQVEWAIALAEAELTTFPLPNTLSYEGSHSPAHLLPPAAAVALLLPRVPTEARLSDTPEPWQRVLLSLATPWPTVLLDRVLQLLVDSLQDRSRQGFKAIRSLLVHSLVAATAPDHYAVVEQRLAECCQLHSEHQPMLEATLHYLQFQRQLTQWLTQLPIGK